MSMKLEELLPVTLSPSSPGVIGIEDQKAIRLLEEFKIPYKICYDIEYGIPTSPKIIYGAGVYDVSDFLQDFHNNTLRKKEKPKFKIRISEELQKMFDETSTNIAKWPPWVLNVPVPHHLHSSQSTTSTEEYMRRHQQKNND